MVKHYEEFRRNIRYLQPPKIKIPFLSNPTFVEYLRVSENYRTKYQTKYHASKRTKRSYESKN